MLSVPALQNDPYKEQTRVGHFQGCHHVQDKTHEIKQKSYFSLGLSGSERANLVIMTLQKIHETGASGVSLTCDGPSSHLTMLEVLGARLDPDNMIPYFPHPSDPKSQVYVLLDIPHMFKLVRNSLASSKVIKSTSGDVKWSFIEALHSVQEREGLLAGTKLKRQHIEWERNKMKVSLATQTLSESVASAIDFCREDLKMPEFQGSEATTEFIRLFDSLFDCFNSRNLFGKKFKAPLKSENYPQWISLFAEASIYIKGLKDRYGKPILSTRLKTAYLGFLTAIESFKGLFQQLVEAGPLSYLITYKFCQDHLELYNGAVRSKLGANNNPTCKQFEWIFKRLLVKLEVCDVKGNCQNLDETSLLVVSSAPQLSKQELDQDASVLLDWDPGFEEEQEDPILADPMLVPL